MTLKYEGDRISRVTPEPKGNGKGGNGGDVITYVLKSFFGPDITNWIRFVLLGALLMWGIMKMAELRNSMVQQSVSVRSALTEYIASNEKWQAVSLEERQKLIRKADARFKRLYQRNGWEYQGLTE